MYAEAKSNVAARSMGRAMPIWSSGTEGVGVGLGVGFADWVGVGVEVGSGVAVGAGDGVGVGVGVGVKEGEGVGVIGCITTRIIKLKVTGVIRFNILGP